MCNGNCAECRQNTIVKELIRKLVNEELVLMARKDGFEVLQLVKIKKEEREYMGILGFGLTIYTDKPHFGLVKTEGFPLPKFVRVFSDLKTLDNLPSNINKDGVANIIELMKAEMVQGFMKEGEGSITELLQDPKYDFTEIIKRILAD